MGKIEINRKVSKLKKIENISIIFFSGNNNFDSAQQLDNL